MTLTHKPAENECGRSTGRRFQKEGPVSGRGAGGTLPWSGLVPVRSENMGRVKEGWK